MIVFLMEGDFAWKVGSKRVGLPPWYDKVMSALIHTQEMYFREFLKAVAKVLGFPSDDACVSHYQEEAEHIKLSQKDQPVQPNAQLLLETQAEVQACKNKKKYNPINNNSLN